MNLRSDFAAWQTAVRRRTFLRRSAYGLGGIALAGLLGPSPFSGAAREKREGPGSPASAIPPSP